MPIAFKTFSLIHSLPQPPVQIAIKRQLVSSTNWAFSKSALQTALLVGNSAFWHFCLLHREYTQWDISD